MLVSVIEGPTLLKIIEQTKRAETYADVLEFRFDLFESIDFSLFALFRKALCIPVIFTYRSNLDDPYETRIERLKNLLKLSPEYMDLEMDLPPRIFSYFSNKTKVICSYHNFKSTPSLDQIYLEMKTRQADIYKICTFANSSLDALTMLSFVSEHKNIAGMCMGLEGQITRILGPVVGSFFTYGCTSRPIVSGQLSIETLCTTYLYKQLNKQTEIYALLGDPIEKSVGHIFHNRIFSLKKTNKIYVKIRIKKEEIASFFSKIDSLPFCGFSVTMPLKEQVFPFLHTICPDAKKMGSVNTIIKKNGWYGLNTDGPGAILAIEKHLSLSNKKVLVIGAGGAAKALIISLLQKNTKIVVVNRTFSKARLLAEKYCIQGERLSSLSKILERGVDLIINTTSDTSSFFKKLQICRNKPVVMDMIYNPSMTAFLAEAKKQRCPIIFGYEMFIYQAKLQQEIFVDYCLTKRKVYKKIDDLFGF